MNARMVRIKKEVRALFWLWLAVMIAGVLPLFLSHSFAKKLNFMSFFLGIPLLATFALGYEFQHRTLSLWLTQPVSRVQLWGEKMGVMFAAVLSVTVVSGSVLFSTFPQVDFSWKVAAVACVIIAAVSAPFWTLAARSTVGGFLLIGVYLSVVNMAVGKTKAAATGADLTPATTIAISIFTLCYAALMLWLSARKLVRFQVSGERAADDLLIAGPIAMPESWTAWLRIRPSGAFLNLVRKELRLLRPLWMLGLLVALYVTLLGLFGLLSSSGLRPRGFLQWAVIGPFVTLCIAMAGVAGVLSLGEERTSGTHSWHMTLPISPLRQWLTKLVMAMFAGFVCAVLAPYLGMIATGSVYGSPLMYVDVRALSDWVTVAPILTFACFWSACAASGTVRAAIWVLPVTTAIFLASSGGSWLGRELAQATGTLKELFISWFHLSPWAFPALTEFGRTGMLWLFFPTFFLALIQSYRLFRAQPQDGALRMLRSVTPLVVVTVLWSFAASSGFIASRWEPFAEVREALDRKNPDKLQLVPTKVELTGESLAKGSQLTPLTRRWLRGANITVAPDHSPLSGYLATIHLASGLECRLRVARFGGTIASCGK